MVMHSNDCELLQRQCGRTDCSSDGKRIAIVAQMCGRRSDTSTLVG